MPPGRRALVKKPYAVRAGSQHIAASLHILGSPGKSGPSELILDARPDSRKVANVRWDPRVAVVIGGADGTTLQCEGVADLPEGDELARCAAAYLAAFPEFESSLNGDVIVIRVRLEWARHGDFRGGSAGYRLVDLT